MNELTVGLIVLFVGSAISLIAYLYKNKLLYHVESIDTQVGINGECLSVSNLEGRVRTLTLQRWTFQNKGFRTLENVELSVDCSNTPASISVESPNTIGKHLVSVESDKTMIIIKAMRLPPNEEIRIRVTMLGWQESIIKDFKGDGGSYKIARRVSHEIKTNIITLMIILGFAVLHIIADLNR